MKITLIGAGAIGSAMALELNRMPEVTSLQVCDARARALQELHRYVQSPKLRSFQLDARDPNVLEPVLRDSNCVIGCTVPQANPNIAQICLSLGIHFCDLGGNDEIVYRELEMDARARERGVWIVPNCGLAPGLANILCLRAIDQFDEVEAAHVRVGDVPLNPEPPFNFRLSWTAEKVVDDYTHPVLVIEDHQVTEAPPLTRQEEIHFREPFGRMEAFCTAGGLSTLIGETQGKIRNLDHKTIRWPGHVDQMRFLLALGFGDDRKIDPRTHLTYRDVLVRRLQQHLGGTYEDAVLLRVLVKGTREGQQKTVVYQMIDTYDAESGTTAMRRCTSIPAAIVAVMLAEGKVEGGGAAPPERIVPADEFFRRLAECGLKIEQWWYDGWGDVTAIRGGANGAATQIP
ncbi:MAG TPA: saccharopine dehydrogenase C-terminal domain-containing protein [Rhodothermales bacterium]